MKNKKLSGFTLAEVLIALVVIGIVAAITLTTVMPNIQERVNSQRQANIVYKVTQATNLMKSNGAMVNGFESTDAFVDELQKYLKIMKRCDSEHIADCWPTKKVIDANGEEFEVSKAKTRGYLGFKDDYIDNKNVGIVLADGASLILTYNPASGGITIGEPVISKTTILPTGGKFQTFLEYTSNTTSGLAFVMDVNGSKGPNKEPQKGNENKKFDIRELNGARFSDIFTFKLITSPTLYPCCENKTNKFCSQKNEEGYSTIVSYDYWAGANNDCEALGGHIPVQDELFVICRSSERRAEYGLTDFVGTLWSSEIGPRTNSRYGVTVTFGRNGSCSGGATERNTGYPQALCLAN